MARKRAMVEFGLDSDAIAPAVKAETSTAGAAVVADPRFGGCAELPRAAALPAPLPGLRRGVAAVLTEAVASIEVTVASWLALDR